jgi:glycosyltransferase involved in cell wall biosynthesis
MRVLCIHNFYQFAGGEDVVFEQEKALLRNHGHTVIEYTAHNRDMEAMSTVQRLKNTFWSQKSYDDIRAILRAEKPDIAHFHNTFMMISPAAYYACRAESVPVVQTLHNYRLLCPAATFFRDGHACEDCMGKLVAYPAVVHACYRDSRMTSAVVAGMLTTHRAIGTWTDVIDRYVVLTEFARDKFIAGGLPGEKLRVKANFLAEDPGAGTQAEDYFIFIGRLTPEKGVRSLLEAWRGLPTARLKLFGVGPLEDEVRSFVKTHHLNHVEVMGQQPRSEVLDTLRKARALIFPSVWYEGMPMTIVEAFACGVPVIAGRLGAAAEMIRDGQNGLLYEAGSADELVKAVNRFSDFDRNALGHAGRGQYERQHTPDANYQALMSIYDELAR